MLKGKVIGNIVSTNKFDSLKGYKFLEIQLIENNELTDKYMVAVDRIISAGIGEEVLVITGSSARAAVGDMDAPVDAVVAGIIDKYQM
jgi:ethanolamine utilization protein EutN